MRRVSSQTLVGREEPLRLLDDVLVSAEQGRPRLVLLAGEAGVGKTRLASELEARASDRGFAVLHGESVVFGGEEFPYAPLVDSLRLMPQAWVADALEDIDEEARDELAVLLPRVRSGRPAAGRFSSRYGQRRLCELVLGLLRRLAVERAPVLIVLEDLHWADRSSRDFVAFAARSLRSERVAFVVTYRTGELPREHPLRQLATEIARRPAVIRLELSPLTEPEVARQLEAICGRPVREALAVELHARSGGNPFFVEELFAAHRDAAGGIPATIADALSTRVRALPPPAQRLLAVVAGAGGRAPHAVLEAVTPGTDLGTAMRAALEAELVVGDDRSVALRHGIVGEVVYGSLVPAERTQLHRTVAAAMAATGAPVAQLAHQWHRAGAPEDALAASVQAGQEAARMYAFSEARGHFERALDLWDAAATRPDPVDRVELLSLTAQAARYTGDRDRAVALGRRALAELDVAAEPVRAARLYERLGEYASWDDRAALECYAHALRLLPPGHAAERARLLAAEGHALMGLRRWEEARERCQVALAVAAEAGADASSAEITLGLVLGFLGDAAEGERHLRQAIEAAERLGSGEQTARGYVHLGELLRLRGDHGGALEAMLTGEAIAARLGMRGSFGTFMYVNAADDLLRLGRWAEAEQRLEAAERLELGVTAGAMYHATAGHLHALRGNASLSRGHLERASKLVGEGLPGEFVTPICSAWAALALAEGDPDAARRHVDAAFAAVGDERDPLYTPMLVSLAVRADADVAERARARRRDDEVAAAASRADRLLADLDRLVARNPAVPDALAHRTLADAERDRLAGRPAPDRWDAAARAWTDLEEPYPAAYARLRQCEALLAAGGDRRTAASLLERAHATAVELGARPLRDDVEALMRRARLRTAPRPEPRPEEDRLLTRRELDVLELLADGLTNRQIGDRLFITEKTVGTHVAHIFEKLDVHSRVEAAGRARVLGVMSRAT